MNDFILNKRSICQRVQNIVWVLGAWYNLKHIARPHGFIVDAKPHNIESTFNVVDLYFRNGCFCALVISRSIYRVIYNRKRRRCIFLTTTCLSLITLCIYADDAGNSTKGRNVKSNLTHRTKLSIPFWVNYGNENVMKIRFIRTPLTIFRVYDNSDFMC